MAKLAARAHEPQAARRLRRLAPRARAMREELDELRNRLAALKNAFAGQSA
jgi:tRNA C32,U32 (ribose-2'-O)-methylase TrmJ